MNHRLGIVFATVATSLVFGLLAVAPASATTFCVPAYSALCPNNGGVNELETNLEDALQTDDSDGFKDTVIIAPGTYVHPDAGTPIIENGTDDLDIIGSGVASSTVTSLSNDNVTLLNLTGDREVSIKDLELLAPASFPDGGGVVLETKADSADNIRIATDNPNTTGIGSTDEGSSFHNLEMAGVNAGTFSSAIDNQSTGADPLVIDGLQIGDAGTAIFQRSATVPLELDRGYIQEPTGPGGFAIRVALGGDADITNSIIERGQQPAINVLVTGSDNSAVDVRNSTIASTGDVTDPAIKANVSNLITGSAQVDVRNSILHGFTNTWDLDAPAANPALGDADLTLLNSNFNPVGTDDGDGALNVSSPTNINLDPLFVAPGNDYHLQAGSPSIDAAAPGTPTDFDGTVRPLDGDGDTIAKPDQGAYESPTIECFEVGKCPLPDPTCETDKDLCPKDRTKPRISKVRFKHGKSPKKGGTLKLVLSEEAKVTATFKPAPKGKGKKKRKALTLKKKGKKGVNKLVIRKGKLKKGKYKVTITARDGAGNTSKSVRKTVKVK